MLLFSGETAAGQIELQNGENYYYHSLDCVLELLVLTEKKLISNPKTWNIEVR